MYILLAALLIAVALWLVLKPARRPKPPNITELKGKASQASRQAAARANELSKDATARATQMYRGLRGRLRFHSHTRGLAKQFKQWVADAALPKRVELYSTLPASAEGFAVWLSELSDKELAGFTQRVAQFCASLSFDLAWLTDPQVSHEPEIKKAVEDAVLLYSVTVWRANNVQQDVQAFLAYQAWRAHPSRHNSFGQQLLSNLIQRGAVPVTPELYLAPEKERLTYALAAIRKVAEEDHATFHVALRQVVGGEAAAPAAAMPPASEPAAEATEAEPAPARRRKAVAEGGVA